MSLARYSATVGGAVVVSVGLLRLSLSEDSWRAAAAAAVLAALNAWAAFALVTWSAGRSNTAFFRAILGGTLARMALLLGAALAAILWLGLSRLAFLLSLLGYFVAFLVLEVGVVHRGRAAEGAR